MAEATPEKKIANAMKAMDEGDFKKAYTAFKKLAAELPDNAEVWYYKAECGNYRDMDLPAARAEAAAMLPMLEALTPDKLHY